MKSTRILNGYILVYVSDHPSSMKSLNWEGYIYEHILVAERHIGRSLSIEEEVHHLNGNRSDNSIENLLILLKSQHTKLHNWLRSGAPGGELLGIKSEISIGYKTNHYCIVCSKVLKRQQTITCSIDCLKTYRQKEPPSREILEQDLSTLSVYGIRTKYRVSDRTVRKWLDNYGLVRK
jgi:hypothetical protein